MKRGIRMSVTDKLPQTEPGRQLAHETWKPKSTILRQAAVLAAALATTPALHAAGASIDSFIASASTVHVGDTVSFFVDYSVVEVGDYWGYVEPEPNPSPGYQTWTEQGGNYSESISSVWLRAEHPAGTVSYFGGASGTWRFDVTFHAAGFQDVRVYGSWEGWASSGGYSNVGERYCDDRGEGLFCDPWVWHYSDSYGGGYIQGGFDRDGWLIIEVLAVPEPATWALWGLGIAGLVGWRRHIARA